MVQTGNVLLKPEFITPETLEQVFDPLPEDYVYKYSWDETPVQVLRRDISNFSLQLWYWPGSWTAIPGQSKTYSASSTSIPAGFLYRGAESGQWVRFFVTPGVSFPNSIIFRVQVVKRTEVNES